MDTNEPNWVELCSMLATVATAVIAGVALFNWKHQKKYELRMEALAKSRSAVDLVRQLRFSLNNFSADLNGAADELDHYREVLDRNRFLYNDILRINENLWASHGDRNNNSEFYSTISDTISSIDTAINEKVTIYLKGILDDIDYERLEKLNLVIRHQGQNDIISSKIERLQKLIIRR